MDHGPHQRVAPTTSRERFAAIDTLRGFALLGILVPNIVAFAWPMSAMTDPLVIGDTPANHFAHTITSTVFLTKFMFLFALLFGSGVVMYARKFDHADARGQYHTKLWEGASLWYIRCVVLLVLGLIHAYGFWYGDILTYYALCGLTVLWWVRRFNPRLLVFGGLGLFLLGSALLVGFSLMGYYSLSQGNHAAAGLGTDPARELAGYSGSFVDAFKTRFLTVLFMQIMLGFFFQPILWGIMCMGIGLTRMKILTGERSLRFYVLSAVIFLGIGIPMTTIAYLVVQHHFAILPGIVWQSVAQPAGVPLALGYGALVIVLAKLADRWSPLRIITTPLAAVGRMALTNYFLHTLLCTTLFYGYGFGFFAQIEFPGLWLVVLGVWTINIIFSMLWLRVFAMGPMEWVWRAITYRQLVPIRRAFTENLPV